MLVNSQSDLSVFSHYSCASRHDSHGFLQAFFRMKSFLPNYRIAKVLLYSAHDTMPYYQYFKRQNITPFIDLNGKGGRPPVYKMILRLIMIAFLFALPGTGCGVMGSKLQRAG